MDNLLLLVHRMPYPPNKGDKIRSYHLLKHLARRYRIHLGTFIDDADDWQHVPRIQGLCATTHFAALNPKTARVRSLGALFCNRSLSLDYYRDRGMHAWVKSTMQAQQIDRILVFSSPMAQYAEAYPKTTRVVDFVDIDSDKWRQYAEKKSGPMRWLYGHEARQLLQYERHVARQCEASLFVSEPEAQLFRTLAPESAGKVGFFNNGVDTEYFSPAISFDTPFAAGERTIVFTGAMDYWPNVDAVQWFAREIFAGLAANMQNLRFYIVGTRPTQDVQALAQLPGVVVTGMVPDVRPYLAHAALAVAPLRIARGIQNKVLEAMAMALTVVVSAQALEGIEATPGRELLLAEDAAQFQKTIAAALAGAAGIDTATIGLAARERVQAAYSWPSKLAPVDRLLEGDFPASAMAAPINAVDAAMPTTIVEKCC